MPETRVQFLADAVDPDNAQWCIEEVDNIDSCVDLKNKVARISKVRTRAQEQTHFHEMAHIEWSKPVHHDTDELSYICRMLDEVRVDWKLKIEKGIEVANRMDDFDLEAYVREIPPKPLIRAGSYLQFRYHAASAHAHPHVKEAFRNIQSTLPVQLTNLLEDAVKSVFKDTSHENLCNEARKIYRYFAPPTPPPTPTFRLTREARDEIAQQKTQEQAEEAEKERAQKAKETGKAPKPLEVSQEERTQKAEEAAKFAEKVAGGAGDYPTIGHAVIHDHLARDQKFTQVKAPFTRTGRGSVPEFMENWCIDKRVYRTDHRGGVIVLDCSGSMSPNYSLIQAQMQEFPNLVVLSYRSAYFPTSTNISGIICVHSRNGRIDPVFLNEAAYGGGNAVDVEALQYGAKFKGPRIWVSDGQACGGQYDDGKWYDYEKGSLPVMIRGMMRKEHYIRVANLEDALAWVNQSRKVHYWTAGILEPVGGSKASRGRNDATDSRHHRYERRAR